MLVSVVINNYNYGRFLRDAIDSALAQTYPNCEVIVVDDGSTDDSREIIASYGNRVRAVLKDNGGQASAFNAGWREARGDFILFLDADDYLYPEAISEGVSKWRPGVGKVHFLLDIVDEHRGLVGRLPSRGQELSRGDCLADLLKDGTASCVPTSGNLFLRAALDSFFPLDERFRICADGLLFYHSAKRGSVEVVEKSLCAYRVHGGNFFVGPGYLTLDVRKAQARALGVFARILFYKDLSNELTVRQIVERHCTYRMVKDLLMFSLSNAPASNFPEIESQLSRKWLYGIYCKKVVAADVSPALKVLYVSEISAIMGLPAALRPTWISGRDALRRVSVKLKKSITRDIKRTVQRRGVLSRSLTEDQ